jgi:sulfate permease, SulP family
MQIGDPRPKIFSLWPVFKTYTFSKFWADFFAALVIALLALPQSIAYAIMAGLPPTSGIISAIFGTIFTASFGKSHYLVAGPSTAIAILIQTTTTTILAVYYPHAMEEEKMALTFHILTHIVFFVGVLHLIFSYCNVAKILQFVSKPVILGYFGGVCLAIITSQLFSFWGIEKNYPESITFMRLLYFFSHLHEIDLLALAVGFISLASLFVLKKAFPKLPYAFFMVVFISSLTYFLAAAYPQRIALLGQMDTGVTLDLALPFFDYKLFGILFPSATAIALLSLLEVFSISRGIAAKSATYSPINQEVFGSGVSNFCLSFFYGAMPSSASATRTMAGFLSGSKTRFAAIFSGMLVAVFAVMFAPLLPFISMGAISALLIASSFSLIETRQIKLCLTTTKADAAVFLVTFFSSIFFTLDTAFYIGIILSIVTYLGRAAIPHFVEYAFNRAGRLCVISSKQSAKRHVRIIGIGGELFFGMVDLLQYTIQTIAKNPYVKVIVLRLNGVYHVDASLCLAILNLHELLQKQGKQLVISGISPEVWQVIFHSKIVDTIGKNNFFLTDEGNPQLSTWKACLRAQEIIES